MTSVRRSFAGIFFSSLLATACASTPAPQPKLELPALDTPASTDAVGSTDARMLFGVFIVEGAKVTTKPSGAPVVSDADIVEARSIAYEDGTIMVRLQLDAPGTARLATATRGHSPKHLAMVVKDVVTGVVEVESEIASGIISMPMAAKNPVDQRVEADDLVRLLGERKHAARR